MKSEYEAMRKLGRSSHGEELTLLEVLNDPLGVVLAQRAGRGDALGDARTLGVVLDDGAAGLLARLD